MMSIKEISGNLLRQMRERLSVQSKNPFEEVPDYLTASDQEEKYLTRGKRLYLRLTEAVVEEMPIPTGEKYLFVIDGGGQGREPERIGKALAKREKEGEDLARVEIKTVEINSVILERIKETTRFEKVKQGLTLGDVTDLSFIPDNCAIFISMSSIGHELGEKGFKKALSEARRILTPNGIIDFRDFYLPTMQRQLVILKSDFAKRFFLEFNKYFFPQEQAAWRREWSWAEEGKTIECSAILAHEIRQKIRFLKRNYGKWGDRVLEHLDTYREFKERYSLEIPTDSVDPVDMMKALIRSTGRLDTDYAFSFRLVPDDDDDRLVARHLQIYELGTKGEKKKSPLSTSSRVIYFIHKLPKGISEEKRDELVKMQYNIIEKASRKAFLEN